MTKAVSGYKFSIGGCWHALASSWEGEGFGIY